MGERMKIFISADLEGISGVMHSSQTQPGEPGYERAVQLMHKEVSAVVEGIYSTGNVSEIFVADAHWDSRNLRHELLPGKVSLITGWQRPFSMMSGVSGQIGSKKIVERGFDGVFFVGYHAMAGAACAVLSHTYRAQIFQEVRLNGQPVGETGLNAALAGYFGVPVAFISGDDAACNEARNLLGSPVCIPVKKAVSRYAAILPPESETLAALQRGAVEALARRNYWSVFNPPSPSTLTLTMVDPAMADAVELLPEVKRTDNRVVEFSHADYSVLFQLFLASGVLAASRKDAYF
jgi:D-amino peptidase